MDTADLAATYRGYIACLNRQDWTNLGQFVADDVQHNDRPVGLAGYRAMLEHDFEVIPDLFFDLRLLVCDPPFVASRLRFDCSPSGPFLSLMAKGRKITFTENVFYDFRDGKILHAWSIIDKAAVEAQLA